jgi:aspartyl-tRNA(Asn)/glutamyl-tRNA(Gln) amidotransferase subunit A
MVEPSLPGLTIGELAAGYRARSFTPVDVVRSVLERLAVTEPLLHAWVEVARDDALASAAEAEAEMTRGFDRGPLHGVPIGVKDIFDVAGMPTRCGSAARDDAPPAARDAAAVAAMRRAGAIVLGKTVTQEFAAGVISAPARNPWDPARVPGGSSGGSAAAVAAGACCAALGSDTGGSIRIPAAACGVVGFKPAFGQLDLSGVFPLAWSLDTPGPIARTVADTAVVYDLLAGTSVSRELVTAAASGAGLRVGVPRPFFFEWVQPEALAIVEQAIGVLRACDVTIVDSPWPEAAAARACAFLINRVETAAVHKRVATEEPERFHRYGAELRLRIAAGRDIPASLYVEALRARPLIRDSVATFFATDRLDAVLAPTLPTVAVAADAPAITGTGRDESIGAGWTRLTMPFNATGQPVLAVPAGLSRDGLPIGVQLAGRPGRETVLFHLGRMLESAVGRLTPPLLSEASGHLKEERP